jgi:hypothetical protein
VTIEYAKAAVDDILVRITATNRGPEAAELHVAPTLWFRNTWAWDVGAKRPRLAAGARGAGYVTVDAEHPTLGARHLFCEGAPPLLFTENETNTARLFDVPNATPYVKDGIGLAIVGGHAGRGESLPGRHQDGAPLPCHGRPGRRGGAAPPAERSRARRGSLRRPPSTW